MTDEPIPLSRAGPTTLVALGSEPRTLHELLCDAAAVAEQLPPAQAGGHVIVLCRDRYHVAVGIVGAWIAGHAVALPPSGRQSMVDLVARHARSAGVLHDGEGPGWDVRPWLGRAGACREAPGFPPLRHLLTLYTSGSTGAPLPCAKTAGQILGEAQLLARHFALGPGARVLPTVPAHHIYGLLWGILAPLAGGAAFARSTPLHAETVAAERAALGADFLVSTPAHLRGLAALAPGALPAALRVISSGAPLPDLTRHMLHERFGLEVTEILGSTETGGLAWRREAGALWKPLPGIGIAADADGRMLADSPFLAPGSARPMPLGDCIELVGADGFRHLGRVDGVVKVAGQRVGIAEMEARLAELEGVSDACVLAVPVTGSRGHELWAAVAAAGWTPERLRVALLAWFDPVVLPRRVRVLPALPREPNGKLTRQSVLHIFSETAVPAAPAAPPPLSLPLRALPVPAANSAEGERLFESRLPEDSECFEGHFPGLPILPGIAQLELLVQRGIAECWPELGYPRSLGNLKFRRPLHPGETVRLRLQRAASALAVAFEMTCGETLCSSGVFGFAAREAG